MLIGVIGGALIFLSSWLMLSVVFPNYLDEMREVNSLQISAVLSSDALSEIIKIKSVLV